CGCLPNTRTISFSVVVILVLHCSAAVSPAGVPGLYRAKVIQGHSIICFAGEDWWYHHPHSKYHLMRRFAKAGNRVIFVNSISMGLPALGNKDLLPRVLRKLRSYARLARSTPEGVT